MSKNPKHIADILKIAKTFFNSFEKEKEEKQFKEIAKKIKGHVNKKSFIDNCVVSDKDDAERYICLMKLLEDIDFNKKLYNILLNDFFKKTNEAIKPEEVAPKIELFKSFYNIIKNCKPGKKNLDIGYEELALLYKANVDFANYIVPNNKNLTNIMQSISNIHNMKETHSPTYDFDVDNTTNVIKYLIKANCAKDWSAFINACIGRLGQNRHLDLFEPLVSIAFSVTDENNKPQLKPIFDFINGYNYSNFSKYNTIYSYMLFALHYFWNGEMVNQRAISFWTTSTNYKSYEADLKTFCKENNAFQYEIWALSLSAQYYHVAIRLFLDVYKEENLDLNYDLAKIVIFYKNAKSIENIDVKNIMKVFIDKYKLEDILLKEESLLSADVDRIDFLTTFCEVSKNEKIFKNLFEEINKTTKDTWSDIFKSNGELLDLAIALYKNFEQSFEVNYGDGLKFFVTNNITDIKFPLDKDKWGQVISLLDKTRKKQLQKDIANKIVELKFDISNGFHIVNEDYFDYNQLSKSIDKIIEVADAFFAEAKNIAVLKFILEILEKGEISNPSKDSSEILNNRYNTYKEKQKKAETLSDSEEIFIKIAERILNAPK